MMKELLDARGLPELMRMADGSPVTARNWPQRRQEIFGILEDQLFGRLPQKPFTQSCELVMEERKYYHGGKSILRVYKLTVEVEGKPFSWRFWYSIPKANLPVPLFLLPCFTRLLPVDSLPTEEIIDGGYGICCFDYQEVSSDDNDFTNGLAALFYPDGVRRAHDGGKIALWAWAASRILDQLLQMPEIDSQKILIVGHSRLGKTALWAGAADPRFGGVISVHSGCGGAAIARGNTGEKVADITKNFGFWFAPAYAAYAGKEETMPFDQHFLLALAAPRRLYVESAAGDLWADPLGEYLDCLAVSPLYETLGLRGAEVAEPQDDMLLHGGDVGYSRRPGTHFFTRLDWQRIMVFFR